MKIEVKSVINPNSKRHYCYGVYFDNVLIKKFQNEHVAALFVAYVVKG